MKLFSCFALVLIGLGVASPTNALAQRPKCGVTITDPANQSRAEGTVLVSGTATLLPNAYAWVFARRQGLSIWWPQGGGAAAVSDGPYKSLVTLGGSSDVGAQFDILAAVLDRTEHMKIEAWFRTAEKTGSYPGIPLPAFMQGCGSPARLVVTRVR